MLKIQRKINGKVVFTLSGRIEAEDIDELRRLLELEGAGKQIVFDLHDVTLVDHEAIQFLTECETNGITLDKCPAYVRERIEREGAQPKPKKARSRGNTRKRGPKP
jgi:hypothetical protein